MTRRITLLLLLDAFGFVAHLLAALFDATLQLLGRLWVPRMGRRRSSRRTRCRWRRRRFRTAGRRSAGLSGFGWSFLTRNSGRQFHFHLVAGRFFENRAALLYLDERPAALIPGHRHAFLQRDCIVFGF